MQHKDYLVTSNINLASTLLALGHTIASMDSKDRRVSFYFEQKPNIENDIDKFWKRELVVEPNEILNSRKELITRIREYQHEN